MQKRTRLQTLIFKAKVLVGAAVGILIVVAVLVAIFAPDTPACDRDAASRREAWIETTSAEFGGSAPKQRGFRVSGECSDTIGDRMLSCSIESARGVHGAGVYLRRARELGFVAYACESASERREFPLSDVLTSP